jgi:hypothetical protein
MLHTRHDRQLDAEELRESKPTTPASFVPARGEADESQRDVRTIAGHEAPVSCSE